MEETVLRLRRLEQILASADAVLRPGDGADPAGQILTAALERVRQLTAFLAMPEADDDVDRLAARLLLNEYAAALVHLRAMTRQAGVRLEGASDPVAEVRRFLWREEKLREKRRDAADLAADQ